MAEEERKEETPKHELKEFMEGKVRPPKKMGHGLADKRPRFKSFKSPGVK